MRRSGWRFCSSLNLAALRVRRLLGTCDPPGARGVFLPGLYRCAVLCGGYANEHLRFARLGQSSPLHEYPTHPRLPWLPLRSSNTIRSQCSALAPVRPGTTFQKEVFSFFAEMRQRFPDACGVFLKGRGLSEPEGRVPQPRKEYPVRVPRLERLSTDGSKSNRASSTSARKISPRHSPLSGSP